MGRRSEETRWGQACYIILRWKLRRIPTEWVATPAFDQQLSCICISTNWKKIKKKEKKRRLIDIYILISPCSHKCLSGSTFLPILCGCGGGFGGYNWPSFPGRAILLYRVLDEFIHIRTAIVWKVEKSQYRTRGNRLGTSVRVVGARGTCSLLHFRPQCASALLSADMAWLWFAIVYWFLYIVL